jgi:hypothetical protein
MRPSSQDRSAKNRRQSQTQVVREEIEPKCLELVVRFLGSCFTRNSLPVVRS